MADVLGVARAVAAGIPGGGEAEVAFAPELDLHGIRDLRIVVVPAGLEIKPVSRGGAEDTFRIQVGVLKKCTPAEIPGLVEKVASIGRGFLGARLGGATCTGAEYAPLYDAAHLRERRQFTGVVELTFKAEARR